MNAPDDIRMPDTAASPLRRWLGPARDTRALDIVLNLTAITLLLRPFDVWWVSPFVLLGFPHCCARKCSINLSLPGRPDHSVHFVAAATAWAA